MSDTQDDNDSTAMLAQLAQVIVSGSLDLLGQEILSQSKLRQRDSVLADALILCCESNHHKAVQYLLEKEQANPNLFAHTIQQYESITPLMSAVQRCQDALQQEGITDSSWTEEPYQICRASGFSPAEADTFSNSIASVSSLLKYGASISKANSKGETVLSKGVRDRDDESMSTGNEPEFIIDLLDIQSEILLLEEVKDIKDELGILKLITEDQTIVVESMFEALRSSNVGFHDKESHKQSPWAEQPKILLQQQIELDSMERQLKDIYKSITDLLDGKQKHTNAIEARYARNLADSTSKQTASTAKAGRILMVFTIVTVIFLPLSFLAAFFAISLDVLPHNDQNEQEMSLAFVMKYVVGVGLSTAFVFVLLAWYLHAIVEWLAKKLSSRASPTKFTSNETGVVMYGTPPSDRSHPFSTSGFRFRKRHPQGDPEMASSGSSQPLAKPD